MHLLIHPTLRNVSANDENWENYFCHCSTGSSYHELHKAFTMKVFIPRVQVWDILSFLSLCMSVSFLYFLKFNILNLKLCPSCSQKFRNGKAKITEPHVCVFMVILMCTYMNVPTHLPTFKFYHFLVNQTYFSSFFKCLDFLLRWQWVASVQGKTLAIRYMKDVLQKLDMLTGAFAVCKSISLKTFNSEWPNREPLLNFKILQVLQL